MWQPTISNENLKKRAELLQMVRHFFYERQVTEVETPQMASAPVTDPYLDAFEVSMHIAGEQKAFYLQTSPEYAMKRLLAAGSGSIYQLAKAFRIDEVGRNHNPEFTMLEWYRVGFDDFALMKEVEALLQLVLNCPAAEYLSYQDAFIQHLGINPHTVAEEVLQALLLQHVGEVPNFAATRNDCLQLLMSSVIEPRLSHGHPIIIYNYPVSQAALARRRVVDGIEVAARFEVFMNGIELANGYYELTDADEQYRRFIKDLAARDSMGKKKVPIDHFLTSALRHGLPDCAGVALGFDRLCLLAIKADHIQEVITFPIHRA